MKSLHTVNGKPVEPKTAAQIPGTPAPGAASVKNSTHKPECGDVGETGEHGDIGSNAAK